MRKRVLVLGSNFGGLTAALAVRRELFDDVDVRVISPADRFLFNPSLIWLPFGKRNPDDITFPVEPTFTKHGIDFVHEAAVEIDADHRQVRTASGTWYAYDYLVVATGYRNNFDAVPGLVEHGVTITTLDNAVAAGEAWRRFLDGLGDGRRGDIVVAASQGAGCFGAAYEFLFNTAYRLRKAGVRSRVNLTYLTAEPFLGHFGIGGLPHGEQLLGSFLRRQHIEARVGVAIEGVGADAVTLTDGTEIPSQYSMVVPPFVGQEVARTASALDPDDKGYLPVRPTYQSEKFDDVYVVGIAAQVVSPWQTAIPIGVPKTGYPTEVQAHVAAQNIAAQIRGQLPEHSKPFDDIAAVCVLDAGNNGVVILADKMLAPKKHGVLIPGPQAHALKLGFEKYFLWKARNGHVQLP
ncbi:MAG: NAD(P)/FAD-dependent oxidoreductase [Jatrophihabitans sp.]|uniref:NAD(P)/FAD-dependent oxidoreductase n=1 Tax=Jatrophihabitans sp. TaxID=1932789 RepID=UPI003F7EA15C